MVVSLTQATNMARSGVFRSFSYLPRAFIPYDASHTIRHISTFMSWPCSSVRYSTCYSYQFKSFVQKSPSVNAATWLQRKVNLTSRLFLGNEFVSENSRSLPSGDTEALPYELKMAAVAARTRCRQMLPKTHEDSRTVTRNLKC